MEIKEKKKSIGKSLLVALVLLIAWFLIIRVGTSFASKNSFEITYAEVSTKSPYVEISNFNFEKGKVKSDVVFHKVGDSITYKLKLRNTDDKTYVIKKVSDNNNNYHVSYRYADYAGKKVNAQDEFTFELTEKYAVENNDVSNREQNLSVILTFEIEDEDGNENEIEIPINADEENIPAPVFPITGGEDTNAEVYHVADDDTVVKVSPKTGDNIVLYVAIFVAAIGLLIVAIRKRNVLEVTEKIHKPHGVKRLKVLSFFVIVGAALFPTISRALANTSITFTSIISFKDKLVVTYKVNGETFEKVVPYESKIELDDPEVPGYKFDRWEDKDGNKFDSETPITNDLELTAIFNPIEYTLSYELNDGTVDPENPTTYTIESADISLTKPTKNGYKFTGWTGTGLEEKTENVTIANGSIDDREYTANWEIEEYTITYNLNEGTLGDKVNPDKYTIETEDIKLNNPTREGYRFTGWTGTDIEEATSEVTINKGSKGNKEYTANWEIEEYTITYNLNEGSLGDKTNPDKYTIETEDIKLNNPTREGYIFDGWTGTDIENATGEVTINKGSKGNKEYTANWTKETYTITYNLEEGSEEIEDIASYPTSIQYMDTYSYKFEDKPEIVSLVVGEKTLVEGTDYTYENGTLTIQNVTGSITMKLKSTVVKYTVTFNANDSSTEVKVKSGKTVQKQSDPSKAENEFIGWYGENDVKFNFSNAITEDITLHAKWNRIEYHYNDSYVFDGTNMLSTDVYLFSERNIGRNFEISFNIANIEPNQRNQATILNSMKEVQPYPGFVFRIKTNATQIEYNAPKIGNKGNYDVKKVNKVVLKRINDIYYIQINDGPIERLGTYTYGETFDVPVVFGGSPDAPSPRYFKGTLSDINIRLWYSEKYTVKFDKNGGTGTMPNQTIREDEEISLSENKFEKEDWIFNGWNTKPDGSGESYSDKQVVKDLVEPNNNVTLYAQWKQDVSYSIRFNSNGGEGTMANQDFLYGRAQQLQENSFTKTNGIFLKWNTKPDGSGISYKNGESVKNLTKTEGEVIDLYALWSVKKYTKSEATFDGTNNINTNVYLFEENTINRDFEISFDIVEQSDVRSSLDTMVSAMDETGYPFSGIVYRWNGGANKHQLAVNVDGRDEKEYDANTTKVNIKRINGVIYLRLNNGETETVKDINALTKTFYVPLTFGSSLDGKGKPQRFFKGTLSNLYVEIF